MFDGNADWSNEGGKKRESADDSGGGDKSKDVITGLRKTDNPGEVVSV